MLIKSEVLAQLDELITEGKKCCVSFVGDGMGGIYSSIDEHELRTFVAQCYITVERIAGRESEYYKQLPSDPNGTAMSNGYGLTKLAAMFGTLKAIRYGVDKGLLVSLESRLRANIHDDFLQQAKSLLDQGYHVAAMVLVGGVLEDHLEKLCTKHGKTVTGNGNLAKYNDALHGLGVYDKPAWRRIQSIGDVRNDAAHGNFAKVNIDDVQDAHKYTSRFLDDNPA